MVNNTFRNSVSLSHGGALYFEFSNITLTNNTFINNSASI